LWSGQFDEHFTDIFAVQDAIATRVAEALAIRLTGRADQKLKRRYTDDAEAYQLYVNGWFQRSRVGEEGFRKSIAFFEQAIARDPNYALPHVGLADSYAMLGVFGAAAPDEVFPRGLAAAHRALEIDSELGEAHASLGHIKVQYERDLPGAEREYQRALHLAPDYATGHLWYGLYLAWTGHVDDGIARLR
jgi:Tfp pilus assembly protein PilF